MMERTGVNSLGRMLAYIKDGLEEINILAETHVKTEKFDITKDQRLYNMPGDMVKITDIRCKNHRNSKDYYTSIPRLLNEPFIKDSE